MKEPVNTDKKELTVENVVKEEIKINDAQIKKWKKEHGKIFKTTVGEEDYIWRKLKRREYVDIMSEGTVDEEEDESNIGNRVYRRQESIARAVVIHPSDIAIRIEEDAGLATSISDEVILKSGFNVATTEEL